jgi:2-C-methyl-D-erythritol 4-phosphate cytidylyltransferase/2-C-methyl-D-erythritol 2,4-cyclodiphosphate synthase
MTEAVAAVIVAAGRGERAGANIPKQYRPIGGEPMIRMTLRAFLAHPGIDFVQPVINPNDRDTYQHAIAGLKGLLPPIAGGVTRQASVRAGLEALASRWFLSMMRLVLLSALRSSTVPSAPVG